VRAADIKVGDYVYLNGGVSFRDKPLPTTIPFIVINVAALYGDDAVFVVREAAYFRMLTADGARLDPTHGIFLAFSDVARVKADA
jgi:hypothetical protein